MTPSVATVVSPPAPPPTTGRNRLTGQGTAGNGGNGNGKPKRLPKVNYTTEEIPVDQIVPSRFQARRIFDEEALASLADSIEKNNMTDLIRVRPLPAKNRPADKPQARYELIYGERRWRAMIAMGHQTITAQVCKADDRTSFSMGAAENNHVNLSPMEEAWQYQRGMEEFDTDQTGVAALCCVSKERVSRLLKLLKLPEAIQAYVATGKIAPSTADLILQVTGEAAQIKVADIVAQEGMSAPQAEALIRQMKSSSEISTSRKAPPRGKIQAVTSLTVVLLAVQRAKKKTAAVLESLTGRQLAALCQKESAVAQDLFDILEGWGEDVGLLKDELRKILRNNKKP